MTQNAGRGSTPALEAVAEAVTRDFTRRLRRMGGWEIVHPDAAMSSSASGGSRSMQLIGTEALVNITVIPTGGDSASLRIQVRNMAPGSAFGYRVVSSDKVADCGPRVPAMTVSEMILMRS